MFFSYHCHSIWSDGRDTIGQMVAAARCADLAEVGLSDHFTLTPYDDTDAGQWSMPRNGRELEDCLRELRVVAAAAEIPVRIGVEADFFPETWSRVLEVLSGLDLDYVIGSVHYVDRFPIDSSAEPWRRLDRDAINAVHRQYYVRLRRMAESGGCDIVGHFDLPKKFGFLPDRAPREEMEAALDAIAASGLALELNTAGWDKPCAEAYPGPSLLEAAFERAIPVVLTADAHRCAEIARHYSRGAALLRDTGYTHMLAWRGRRSFPMPIPLSRGPGERRDDRRKKGEAS
ncbi:MAG: histidinol-phosphatase HisJ family protein [Kiritimatiellaeota bacterium]|nr:histidinol-phosphatase HisJ family protein [Kiritimatiellota bacterium]